MKCTVTFLVNNEPIELALETEQGSSLTDQDIIKVLQENPDKREEISNTIHNLLYKKAHIEEVTINDLKSHKGLLGNCGVEYLRNEFPQVSFPEGVEANVLLIDNLRIGRKSIHGRVINSNGEEIFVVKGIEADVQKLADFLSFRKQIEEHSELFDEESIWLKKLNKIFQTKNVRKKDQISDLRELLLDYNYNKSAYNFFITNDDGTKESAYNILQTVVNIVRQYYTRTDYADPFIDTISKQVSYLSNGKKTLKLEFLYKAVKQLYPDILDKLELKSQSQFHEFFRETNNQEKLKEVFEEVLDGEGYKTLFFNLFKVDPDFQLFFTHSTDKGVVFKSAPKTLISKYGIDWDTIVSFDIVDEERDYKIYKFWDKEKNKEQFIPSREYLVEDSLTTVYDSIEDAKEYARNSSDKQDIKKNALLEFKYSLKTVDKEGNSTYTNTLNSFKFLSQQNLIPQSIIESINIPIVKDTQFSLKNEEALISQDGQNRSSFKQIIDSWSIFDEVKKLIYESINTPEKIAIFIYKVNEFLGQDRTNESEMRDIVKMIEEAPKEAYYIESKTWNKGKKKFEYIVIPTDAIVVENYRKGNKRTPVISLMQSIQKVMSENFNVNVNLLTSDQIKEQFDTVDPNTAKAFIRDGQIYINTTIARPSDLLHEYTHLILGILKNDPDLRSNYEQLMYMVSDTTEGKLLKRKLQSVYNEVNEETGEIIKKVSDLDLMEEVFVKMFGNYVMSDVNPDLKRIFKSQDKLLKDVTKIVFNGQITDLRSFYGKGVESIFRRFSSDVAYLLDQRKLDFGSTKTSRQYSNWISEQIRNKNIKEECYG